MSDTRTGAARTSGHVEVFALEGIPEVRPGDDLSALLVAALGRAADALPLREDDVLVVTQKVVSKAEGAIVDLTTVEPRPEAVEFARRWDRDPRQLEVVLREARRVVRWQNGVLITETPHGFVCANGGVDASNVGPESGSIVTLLPGAWRSSSCAEEITGNPGASWRTVRRRRRGSFSAFRRHSRRRRR